MGKRESRLRGLRVYLSGPMEYAKGEGVEWRKMITPYLKKLGLVILDPTARPVRLSYAENSASEQLGMLKDLRKNGKFETLVKYAREIVHQDLRMVDVADLLIVFIDATVPTVGTIDEFVTGCNQKKPILVCCAQGRRALPVWVWGRLGNSWKQSLCKDFDDMIDRLNKIAYCSDKKLDKIVDRSKWLFLGACS